MKLRVEPVASARRAASLFGLLGFLAAPALAGDRAQIDLIGFSPDARYFAFEEFGIRDGSGLAYSSIFVVDLTEDAWVSGSPIRREADDESKSLQTVRTGAMNAALPLITGNDIAVAADLVALNGDGQPGLDGKTLAFGRPGYNEGTVLDERDLTISSFESQSTEDCETYFGTAPVGFELTMTADGETKILHRDDGKLPASRGCAMDYRIYGVALPALDGEAETGAVIVAVYAGSFEGNDRRFLVVPFAF
ncbi:DUF2259 domain-containing protein [Devosia sp. Leaf420]|uniref:DUF2259 domain-containing protein n=1 Tax=Devosia sp. Leaf420 TaxID=1736374 RepID=UPI000783108D|nr:DUF2259 domain-containing protein [Devosia sp. Leaf420]